jgi:hypothetical protein
MISNLAIEHAFTGETVPLLEVLFRYIDQLFFWKHLNVTGRPPVSKKALVKCFFLKTYFAIGSLRQLMNVLRWFSYFRRICGLPEVPRLSTPFHGPVNGSKNKDFLTFITMYAFALRK